MNDSKKTEDRRTDSTPGSGTDRNAKKAKARPYKAPLIETFSGQQILREIGPAQGYSGTVGGVDTPF